ncbi:TRAP transporter small permease [Vineibacter terrae]|uniref:TRAP transporter small permease n=1 Tax=Vineibacter terrae TaxID=2586908 RepID=UPI002E36ECC0|nr:TRAP transporter small permease [Vineibacter terrae]HEX2886397.1 TRAP transporter small permease [Vineibacter terrae]
MLHALETGLRRIDWVLARITAIAIIAVMVIIVCDVIGRYAFSQPIAWVYDLVSIYFINMILYLMASETLRTRGHIALDLHTRLLPPRAWSLLQALAWLAVALTLLLACWRIALGTWESFEAREVHPGLYEWPVWLEKGIVALGLALLACRIAVRMARFCLSGGDAEVFSADESDREGVR